MTGLLIIAAVALFASILALAYVGLVLFINACVFGQEFLHRIFQ